MNNRDLPQATLEFDTVSSLALIIISAFGLGGIAGAAITWIFIKVLA